MITETALDWFDRCQRSSKRKRRRRNGSTAGSSWHDDETSETSGIHGAADPTTAAWRLLRFGKSGIAPIDAAWKRSRDGRLEPGRNQARPMFLPPVTVLEGPKDVGKTWMLLTLAARFVVATRASRFKNYWHSDDGEERGTNATNKRRKLYPNRNSNKDETDEDGSSNGRKEDQPKVLLLDSTYDFSLPQLTNLVRLTLLRERQKDRQHIRGIQQRGRGCQPGGQRQSVGNNEGSQRITGGFREDKHNSCQQQQERSIEDELESQEREKTSLEQDMEDCLSRIHIIQCDNGPTGWVSILEALTYQLSEDRHLRNECNNDSNNIFSRGIETSAAGPPTLLLWDGFLSDMSPSTNVMMAQTTSVVLGESIGNYSSSQVLFDNPSTQELLIQLSRLLQKEPDALWLVLTTRTVSTPGSVTTIDTVSDSYAPAATEQSGIGLRLTEWIRKDEERRLRDIESGFARSERQSLTRHHNLKPKQPQRASYRIRLDRRHECLATGERSIPSTTAAAAALFAKIVGCAGATTGFVGHRNDGNTGDGGGGGEAGNRNAPVNDEKIPYSISIGGILS